MTNTNSWRSFVEAAPQKLISQVPSRTIVYLDTKNDHPLPGNPDHKFRPVLLITGKVDIPQLGFCQKLFNSLQPDTDYSIFFIPLTTQHHPDLQPIHNSHVELPWNRITSNFKQNKRGYLKPREIFALKDKELYALEASDVDLQHVPMLGRLDDETYSQLVKQSYQNIINTEAILHPNLKTKSLLQRLDWHDKYGSRGGENPLVASYKQQHPATHRFQRPALNQPPIKEPDDGPDL